PLPDRGNRAVAAVYRVDGDAMHAWQLLQRGDRRRLRVRQTAVAKREIVTRKQLQVVQCEKRVISLGAHFRQLFADDVDDSSGGNLRVETAADTKIQRDVV